MNDQPVVVQPKPWWESKTMWINGLTTLAAILAFVVDMQTTGGLPFELDPRWVAIALGVINIVLRTVTVAPVTKS